LAEAANHPTHEVVSSEEEPLILVDPADREIGYLSKGACHDGDGVLHRAFSLFIFNSAGQLLLQQRSAGKRLWPLYWSNTCCSHPRRGETMEVATQRRLAEELGMASHLRHLFTFQYQAAYLDLGSENEVCWVFAGRCDDPPRPNSTEISAVRWITADELDREFLDRPEVFTPWFAQEWPRVRDAVSQVLRLT
jgi:isopentenyl-diphosphate delta-isomerase